MWQMKDNGWTPRQYPTDVYGGGGAPYVRSFPIFLNMLQLRISEYVITVLGTIIFCSINYWYIIDKFSDVGTGTISWHTYIF